MARPRKCRWVGFEPGVTFFKPQGVPMRSLEQVVISVDELEALRLSDFLGLSQEEVAQEMNVSRPTVTRMLAKAHGAVADALVHGKAIKIAGGDYRVAERRFVCQDCDHTWSNNNDSTTSQNCPRCQGSSIQRLFT
ncbi:DUF134 domain-containing protein [Desulfobacca acetoxidans]|uniref:UPF0251 protein Desac_0272 n=1 Tax=Desulfobacca acetoxidans (strain ATCC 700848 / DSM 11109 / ASRB2) TaxID=880072 RepID=F2NEH4_DESAR|nr:DUF134 domain-containing protein [Desulfobacca acetoxidans]AEB08164.1 UPF0251 protein [Desulfobacca acetoxidans DSM 11109]